VIGSDLSPLFAQVLAVGVLFALYLDVRRDLLRLVTARSVVLVGYLSWFLLEALIVPTYLSQTYTQEQYDFAAFLLGLSIASFLIGYHYLRPLAQIDAMALRLSILEEPRYLWSVTLVAASIGLAPVLYYGGWDLIDTVRGFLGMRQTWGGAIGRAQYGGFRDAMLMLEIFLLGLAGLAAVYALRRDQPAWKRIVALLVVAYSFLRAYGSGTRSSLLITAIPILAAVTWKFPVHWRRRLLILALPASLLFYEFSVAVVAGRNEGTLAWGADVDYVGFEMFRELVFISTHFPESYDFVWGRSYLAELVNPIPRFLWADKPARFGIEYAQLVAPGAEGYTVSYGIVGEMFMNFGTFGVIVISLIGGWLCRTWDRLAAVAFERITVMAFYAMGLAALFVSGRSFTFAVFYQTIFIFFAVTVVTQRRYRLLRQGWEPLP
jgi:oligosaccharide repeat unit polymerase